RVRIVSSGVDDVASCRSMKRLQQEVDAIKSASNCKQIVQFYGITFHESNKGPGKSTNLRRPDQYSLLSTLQFYG
ncbi:hypothetical protein TELCIR_19029, partial [Teladorsagia circumcincta]